MKQQAVKRKEAHDAAAAAFAELLGVGGVLDNVDSDRVDAATATSQSRRICLASMLADLWRATVVMPKITVDCAVKMLESGARL